MTKSIRVLSTIVFVSAFATHIHEARADQYTCSKTSVDKETENRAKAAWNEGLESNAKKDYAATIIAWEKAYSLDCTASLLLYYIGRAYEENEQPEKALRAYRAFTDAEEETKQHKKELAKAKPAIDRLEKIVPEQPVAETPAQPAPVPKEELIPLPVHASSAPPPQAQPKTIPIVLTIAGTALAAGGGFYFVNRRAAVSRMEDSCPNNLCEKNAQAESGNRANAQSNFGLGVGITGLVIAGVGVTWLAVSGSSHEAQPQTASSIHPWIGPRGAGASYQTTF